MRATATGLPALAVLGLAASLAQAQGYPPNCVQRCAPDACNSAFYSPNCCGCLSGPNYCLRPPFPPFNGLLPIPGQYGKEGPTPAYAAVPGVRPPPVLRPAYPGYPPGVPGVPGYPGGGPGCPPVAAFPTHPYAHGPRDFFMWGQQFND